MDKQILHSIFETATAGQQINISFIDPFNDLNGDYILTASKSGRGRGGSRVIELKSASDSSITLTSLNINGQQKLLGTSVSEYISGVIIGNNIYGTEEKFKMSKEKKEKPIRKNSAIKEEKPAVIAARKVAYILGNILKNNPSVAFKIIGQRNLSQATGEWNVSKFLFEDQKLTMELVGYEKKELKFSFDSETHGHLIKDVSIINIT
jgi:hypothetical protein